MSRRLFKLGDDAQKHLVCSYVMQAPYGYWVELRENTRSRDQNSKLWAMLTDVSTQVTWVDGRKYTPEDWKDLFMHALHGARWMPSEEGGMIPLSFRSSRLTKTEFGDLIELIYAFGAKRGVVWSEPKEDAA